MSSIKVRVGAQLDAGAARVFDPLIAAAARARKAIGGQGKAGAEEYVGGYRTAPAQARKGFDEVAKAAKEADKKSVASAKEAAKARVQAVHDESADIARELKRREQTARRMISSAGRTLGGIVRGGVGVAGSVARGAGVDFDISSLTAKHVALEKKTRDIAASGYVEGAAGTVGQRRDPKEIAEKSRAAANAAAMSTEDVAAGLGKFVDKSTDIDTGLALLTKMAVLSKTTASDMGDVMSAAGDVAKKLGDIPDKANIVASIMSTIARQGAVGATVMHDMAKVIPTMIGPANQFKEGAQKAIEELGAVYQITSKYGGTKGPAQTAASVASFASLLTSKPGQKALVNVLGADKVYADKGHTKLNPLADILPAVMEKAGGSLSKLSAMLPQVRAGAVGKAFAQIYNDAEAKKKGSGKAAVAGAFGEYGGAMSQTQQEQTLAGMMTDTASKAQLFQNRLEQLASQNLPRLLDAMEKLAPSALSAAEAFAKLVGWAATNPGEAIVAAIVASIAKAAAGEALTKGLAALLAQAGGGALGGAGGGGALGTAGAYGAAGLAGVALGVGVASSVMEKIDAGASAEIDTPQKTGDAIGKALAEYKATGALSPETRQALVASEASNKAEIAKGQAAPSLLGLLSFGPGSASATEYGAGQGAKMNTGTLTNQNMTIEALLHAPAKTQAQAAEAMAKHVAAFGKAVGEMNKGGGSTTGPVPLR
jgi:hypothetical protein